MRPWAADILHYWFDIIGLHNWFHSGPDLDHEIKARFAPLWESQAREAAIFFVTSPSEALAATILFDQFPRNMFRHEANAFATDGLALEISKLAIEAGFDNQIPTDRRQFLYMPFMHSECLTDQDMSVELFDRLGQADQFRYAIMHRDLIRRFGRFPHRNEILGRQSLPEEIEAIAEGSNW